MKTCWNSSIGQPTRSETELLLQYIYERIVTCFPLYLGAYEWTFYSITDNVRVDVNACWRHISTPTKNTICCYPDSRATAVLLTTNYNCPARHPAFPPQLARGGRPESGGSSRKIHINTWLQLLLDWIAFCSFSGARLFSSNQDSTVQSDCNNSL